MHKGVQVLLQVAGSRAGALSHHAPLPIPGLQNLYAPPQCLFKNIYIESLIMFQGSSLTKFGGVVAGKVCAKLQLAAGNLTD